MPKGRKKYVSFSGFHLWRTDACDSAESSHDAVACLYGLEREFHITLQMRRWRLAGENPKETYPDQQGNGGENNEGYNQSSCQPQMLLRYYFARCREFAHASHPNVEKLKIGQPCKTHHRNGSEPKVPPLTDWLPTLRCCKWRALRRSHTADEKKSWGLYPRPQQRCAEPKYIPPNGERNCLTEGSRILAEPKTISWFWKNWREELQHRRGKLRRSTQSDRSVVPFDGSARSQSWFL